MSHISVITDPTRFMEVPEEIRFYAPFSSEFSVHGDFYLQAAGNLSLAELGTLTQWLSDHGFAVENTEIPTPEGSHKVREISVKKTDNSGALWSDNYGRKKREAEILCLVCIAFDDNPEEWVINEVKEEPSEG